MDGIEALDKSQTYFVYCRSGARSAQACQIFKQKGIVDCYNLLGGILEWEGEIVN
jgi:rhodanese-related sulfurtransferase